MNPHFPQPISHRLRHVSALGKTGFQVVISVVGASKMHTIVSWSTCRIIAIEETVETEDVFEESCEEVPGVRRFGLVSVVHGDLFSLCL